MKKYVWVGAAYEDLRKAKEAYRYWQLGTENIKKEFMILMKLNLIGINGKCIINMKF